MEFMKRWIENRNRIRRYDLDRIFRSVPKKAFSAGLELGAGDGFQSRILIHYCDSLICTEYNNKRLNHSLQKELPGLSFKVCDAENLPFKDDSFDFIFSSNLLEHIKNKTQCLAELKRVLKKNGIMIHVMPNRLMKFFNFVLYYPFVLYMLLSKERRKIALKKMKSDETRDNVKSKKRTLFKRLFPSVHGEYPDHITEFARFGRENWIRLFEKAGFTVKDTKRLSLSSTYRFGFHSLRKIGIKLGLCTSFAYIVTNTGSGNNKANYFMK